MPAIVAFGRRWQIGSDDLVLPSLIDLIFRITWLILIAVRFCEQNFYLSTNSSHCRNANSQTLLTGILISSFIFLLTALLADFALLLISKSGTIMNVYPRRHSSKVLYIRFIIQILEICIGIGAFIFYYNDFGICDLLNNDTNNLRLLKDLFLSNLVLTALALIILLVTFDPLGKSDLISNYGNYLNELPPKSKHTQLWEFRCKLLTCAFRRKERTVHESFSECGKILGGGLRDIDWVPSDITAALVLLYEENSREGYNDKKLSPKALENYELILKEPTQNPVSPEWNSPKLILHFLKYGSAGYTKMAVCFTRKNPVMRLFKNSTFCSCIPGRSTPVEAEGDNCCFCHTGAIKDIIEDDFENLVHVTYRNDYFVTPFFIATDHRTKSIVISIRPSLSIKDFITDLTCWPVPLEIAHLPSHFMCHHGIKLAAHILREKISSLNILEKLFQEHKNYDLVLTGNSLGAATSVVLGMMLRPKYPSLRVYAFSPPGGLLSEDAAEYCNDFVTSVIYGDDLVARLSILACQRLKFRMISALNSCKLPKHRILLNGCWLFCGNKIKKVTESENECKNNTTQLLMGHENHLVQNNTQEESNRVKDKELANNEEDLMNGKGFLCVPLYLPGRIFYISEKSKTRDKCDRKRWSYEWTDRKSFNEFIISPRMALDHMPFRMKKALEKLSIQSN